MHFTLADVGMRSDALNPVTSVKLYNSIAVPKILYGNELWNNMSQTAIDAVYKLQH